jgi:hypothetical protein
MILETFFLMEEKHAIHVQIFHETSRLQPGVRISADNDGQESRFG